MAKLVDMYSADKQPIIKRRQLPLLVHDNLTMIMDLNSTGLICDNPAVKGREYEEFVSKYRSLSEEELAAALRVTCADVVAVLNHTVPCVGCRRNVERLFYQLLSSGHPTLEPLLMRPDAQLTLAPHTIANPNALAALLNGHSTGMECVMESQPRLKKSRRCALHSLEGSGARAGPGAAAGAGAGGCCARGAWRDAWDAMNVPCRQHFTLIHFSTLHDTLHNYLRKHRFCADCKTKVLRAYQLLTEEKDPCSEKGYVGSLYAGIKRCLQDKHLHLEPHTDYIAGLVARAEPELLGSHRERHAKTLEIAQEEVLICLGMCVYERLQRLWLRLREEEGTCQLLAAVGVEALYRRFETAVENKTGVSKLQLLYDELAHEEMQRRHKNHLKKLRRRKKKERQQSEHRRAARTCGMAAEAEAEVAEAEGEEDAVCECGECAACPDAGDQSADCGYSSESPGGSDVACGPSCCHPHTLTLSLQDMLSDTGSSDEECDTSYIPLEEVLAFRARRNITEERQQLRQTLRNKFAQLCTATRPSPPHAHA